MSQNQSIYLIKTERPTSCFLDQIYDPDLDGPWTEDSPKLVPAEGASVFDRNTSYLYYVESVHPDTLKTTLGIPKLVVTEEGDQPKVLSYGNDKFMLFFDDRVNPTKLFIDGKLLVFGSGLVEYRLVRTNPGGDKEVISIYRNTNGAYTSDRIPLSDVSSLTGTKQLTNCHTLSLIQEGDTVEAEIYDSFGSLSVIVELFTKRATVLNDLLSSTDVIVEFDATSNQMLGSDFYIRQRQSIDNLSIVPTVKYSDGTSENLVVDNTSCFIYGLENFVPSFPGQQQKILIKKFLNNRLVSTISESSGDKRFISCEKWITVVQNDSIDNIKISVIPYWDYGMAGYQLKYVAYSDRRDRVYDVTNFVTYLSHFDGNNYSEYQMVDVELDLRNIFDITEDVVHRQVFFIKLKYVSDYQKYLIAGSMDSSAKVYGVESSTSRRPILHYDITLKMFFVPTSTWLEKDTFLDDFYYKATPPYNTNSEVAPIVPTHFTVRRADTLGTIITTPMAVEQYSSAWSAIMDIEPSNLVGSTVIFEFLEKIGEDYKILYGVPVDVMQSITGYNV